VAADVATAADTARPAAAPDRPLVVRAGWVLAAAGALGIVGQLLFFGVGVGANVPIAFVLLLAGGWILRRVPRPALHDAWLGPGAVLFASFAAIRADPSLVALDILTALGLAGGALASYGGRSVVSRGIGGLVALGAGTLGWAFAGAIPAVSDARRSMPPGRSALREAAPAAMPVLRGLAIAVPVLLVFVALFASADAVFASAIDDLFGFELDLGDAGWRLAVAAFLAWFAAGGLALAASRPGSDAPELRLALPRIGATELATVLTAVVALFTVFVGLQAAYLFGGLDTLQAAGLTYADYARRGFFELVAVAVLAGGLIVAAERLASERSRWLLSAAIGLAALTGVVLASAALRLRLYQDAYGWTELRLYVLATIVVLGVGLVALIGALAWDRVRWIGHVLLVTGLVIGAALNVIGPVRFITEQNVARVLQPELVPPTGSSGLDAWYLVALGDDAVPSLLRVLPALDPDERAFLGSELRIRLETLRNDDGLTAWQAWNAGRSAARDALEAAAAAGDLR
jgi:hypothetical protein